MLRNIFGLTIRNVLLDKLRNFFFDRLRTPIGEAQIVCDGEGKLRVFGWHNREHRWKPKMQAQYGDVDFIERSNPFGITAMIASYMDGKVEALDRIPVAFTGTPFQNAVWRALRTIPAGETLSYRELAHRIGEPKAVRAVGLANGANPVAVVVPCHRVIGSDGSLTGYGGGLDRKRWLLAHEARHAHVGLFHREKLA